MAEYLLDKLKEYGESDYYPLHMPGHKRQLGCIENPFAIDITEIEGFDNLHHAEGILLEAQKRAARLYGADETYYLVNGSTCGILAAVSACVPRGGRILMARNCHKAVYHAVFLNGLQAEYLFPGTDMIRGISGSILPEDVKKALERQQAVSAVLITSPTYDGVVSDIRRIAAEVHKAGAILIVDEAHGAHFAMHSYFPESALACGADIVINSLHKTMPSLTQTALLHVRGHRADRERLRKYLGIYQSSSPSYVLMAGMDACVKLMERQRTELFDIFTRRLENMRQELSQLQALHLVQGDEAGLQAFDFDRSKVLISTENAGLSGPELSELLRREYHLEAEMEAEGYVTAIMTVADTAEGFERLTKALREIDSRLLTKALREIDGRPLTKALREIDSRPLTEALRGIDSRPLKKSPRAQDGTQPGKASEQGKSSGLHIEVFRENQAGMTMEQAENSGRKQIPLQDAAGCISAEFVYLYPPGIPLLVPGERIAEGLPEKLAYYQSAGLKLQGMADYSGKKIYVVDEK